MEASSGQAMLVARPRAIVKDRKYLEGNLCDLHPIGSQQHDTRTLLKQNLDALALHQNPKLSVRLRIRLDRLGYPHSPPPGPLVYVGANRLNYFGRYTSRSFRNKVAPIYPHLGNVASHLCYLRTSRKRCPTGPLIGSPERNSALMCPPKFTTYAA